MDGGWYQSLVGRMIWSSAQPHSVSDMVGKCFGVDNGAKVEDAANINGWYSENDNENESDDFVAIWARYTLGLSEMQYRKSPFASLLLTTHFIPPQTTTKDLEKPLRSSSNGNYSRTRMPFMGLCSARGGPPPSS